MHRRASFSVFAPRRVVSVHSRQRGREGAQATSAEAGIRKALETAAKLRQFFPSAQPVQASKGIPTPGDGLVAMALAEALDGMRKPTRLRAVGIVGGRAEPWELSRANFPDIGRCLSSFLPQFGTSSTNIGQCGQVSTKVGPMPLLGRFRFMQRPGD